MKEGEIEVIEDNSIFNKHLDEILYFFQVTDYNVVIIEDLDRFGTPSIFLKLRELNQLINESKIVADISLLSMLLKMTFLKMKKEQSSLTLLQR